LRSLAADKKVRDPELKRKQEEMDRLAPNGLEPLREEVARLENLHQASESEAAWQPGSIQLPPDAVGLERLAGKLKEDIGKNETKIADLEQEVEEIDQEINGNPEAVSASKKSAKADQNKTPAPGLRQQDAAAKELLTTFNATADAHRVNLQRVQTAEQIEQGVKEAETAVGDARKAVESAKLSESEQTIRERLDTANEGLRALPGLLSEVEKEFHHIEGALRLSEGLHQKRAAATARVEELSEQTERAKLQCEAFDRLYALFEECREKQLGTVMGPIHDRLIRWMRLLRIGGYQSIRFNDQLLPEKLVAGDGAIELTLGEESTGTIEQIALMVRLALGSTLSTPEEPVVAMLDDPLTHSDVVRLDLMRAVLKNAAGGDTGSTRPAGPMQLVVFTCHPEWFAIDGARVVDLGNPEVLSRLV
jgi:predicted  nucleic acid-binding Zn-ribbon protein